ncbi:7993_t:CDS:2, partial [Diversispora eburnea]
MVVFHTVTSFVTFHYDQSNDIQDTDPWLHFEPSKKQYEKLFDLSSAYHNKLPTISEINKQFDEPSNITNITKKSININPYIFEEAQLVPESEIYRPQLFVPDPIGINPNSITNIRKVLEHIKEISGIKDKINMLKLFVKLNWNIDIRDFVQCQRYQNENQLQFFKKYSDHHKAWDSVCNIYKHAMASKLMWPYVISEENLFVEGYLEWAQNQTDPIFKL